MNVLCSLKEQTFHPAHQAQDFSLISAFFILGRSCCDTQLSAQNMQSGWRDEVGMNLLDGVTRLSPPFCAQTQSLCTFWKLLS